MTSPAQQEHAPTPPASAPAARGGLSGKVLVVAFASLFAIVAVRSGLRALEQGGGFGPPPTQRAPLPDEPLLEGLEGLEGDALAARKRALAAAIACIETERCDDVADPARVRRRRSGPFRSALSALQRRGGRR